MKYIIIGVVSLLCILFIVCYLYYTFKIKVRYLTIKNKEIDFKTYENKGIKIIYFSDLHIGTLLKKKELIKRVEKLKALDGDIYIFGGDLFGINTPKYYNIEDIKEVFSPLKGKTLLAVKGNHDYKKEKKIDLKYKEDLFSSLGFKVLKNESINYQDKITIYGVDDYLYNDNIAVKDNYDLIIAHEPDDIKCLDNQIILSGHTHGGQIKIPFIPLYYKPKLGKKYRYGQYSYNKSKIIVSSGYGYGLMKIRLFTNCEILCIDYVK